MATVHSRASTVTGRAEGITGRAPVALRVLVKPVLEGGAGRVRFHAEGFLETDALSEIPYTNGRYERAVLQEAYVEADVKSFTFKLGLQAVRWSESWSRPSLDFWTARRADRYFLDPLPEQLKHPAGLLVRFARTKWEIEAFASARTAQDSLPRDFPAVAENWRADGGLRAKFRLRGFDVAPVYARIMEHHRLGVSVSYALQTSVLKLEVGQDEAAQFAVAGTDFFLGSWSILPQYTVYRVRQGEVDSLRFRHLGTLPVRYENGNYALEIQFLVQPNVVLATAAPELFWSLEGRRSLGDVFSVSIFVQDYVGAEAAGYLSSFNSLVESSPIVGLRLSATVGF